LNGSRIGSAANERVPSGKTHNEIYHQLAPIQRTISLLHSSSYPLLLVSLIS
jgi:hypothetical protein